MKKKLIKIMKLSGFLLLFTVLQVLAVDSYSQRTKLTLNLKNVTVEDALKTIEDQSEFFFLYSPKMVDVSRKVDIELADKKVDFILNQMFAGTGVDYVIKDRQIVITTDEMIQPFKKETAQQIVVTGKVTDEDGNSLPGVNIVIKGTVSGTISDADGNYSLNVENQDATLVFSFIGYRIQEVDIAGRAVINITLNIEAFGLDEVVAIGYSTVTRGELTGSVFSVSMEQIENEVSGQISKALQGNVPGITVVSNGTPGSDAEIKVRGVGTINNTNPLWVVDGVSVASPPPTHEVESIHVLKDAAATAIYGARGANGVILVKTKSGKKNVAPQVSLNIRTGISSSTGKLDLLRTPQEYGELTWLKYKNSGLGNPFSPLFGSGQEPDVPEYLLPARAEPGSPEVDPESYDLEFPGIHQIVKTDPNGTDWYNEISQNGILQDYNLSVTGGTENSAYFLSAGYLSEEGIAKYTGYKRYSVRLNETVNVTDWLTIGGKVSFISTVRTGRLNNNYRNSIFCVAYLANPIMPVYDVMGNFAGNSIPTLGIGGGNNPLAQLWRARYNKNKFETNNESLFVEISPITGLKVKSQFSYVGDKSEFNSLGYKEPEHFRKTDINSLNTGFSSTKKWILTNTVNFRRTFDKHKIGILLGTEAIESNFKNLTGYRENYFLTDPNFMVINAGTSNVQNSGNVWSWSLLSYFGRIHYEFFNKYLLDVTFRRDGSSRFGELNRWANFPAFAAGWRISEEGFMDGTEDWLNSLKIRASWGKSGNDRIGNYNSYSTYGSGMGNSYYPITGADNSITSGYQSLIYGNNKTHWETTTTKNVGIDATLFEFIDLTVDLWHRDTEDMLFQKGIPAVTGYATFPFVNIGKMENRGVDIALSINGSALANDLKYSISTNFSHYKNKIVKLTGVENEFVRGSSTDLFPAITRAEEGTSFPEYYGYEVVGIFQTQEEAANWPTAFGGGYNMPGHWKFKDVNGDGIIDPDDRTYLGSPHPDFTVGLNTYVSYKGFDLFANFYASYGNDIIALWKLYTETNAWVGARSPETLYKSWGSPYLDDNNDAVFPMSEIDDSHIRDATSHFIEDGSYLRLRNLQIGYTVPYKLVRRLKMKNMRIFIMGTNLFTLTKYDGLDPEIGNTFGESINFGQDIGSWPISQHYELGIKIDF